MKSFKDGTGRIWEVNITAAAIKRVKSLIGVDLYALIEDGFKPFMELIESPVELVDVLYCVCKPQADSLAVTDEQFGEQMAGDVLLAASEAFAESYADFFREPRIRAQMRELRRKMKVVQDRLTERGERLVSSLDPEEAAKELIKLLDEEAAARMSKKPSGISPESSESTPDLSPSRN
jgi:hypothetical protein